MGDTARTPPTTPKLRAGPFADVVGSIVIAACYLAAVGAWLLAGDLLPGGRWLAVHLFTLGFLSTVILAFTHHFAVTLTHSKTQRPQIQMLLYHAGAIGVLVGIPSGNMALLLGGVTVTTGVVFVAYWQLRTLRMTALGARFAGVVRLYERAHGAFLHGAILGALSGATIVTGVWWGSVRMAHLHANVLGWAGLTLAATLVFFGPTMAYTKILPGADMRALRQLRIGAHLLTIAVFALIFTGASGTAGTVSRLIAASALAGLAAVVTSVCVSVARAVWGAKHSAQRPLVLAVSVWFPLVIWADAYLVATSSWRWLDAIGVAAFTGVLLQAVLATFMYVAPILRGNTAAARERLRERLTRLANIRAVVMSVGAASVVIGTSQQPTVFPAVAVGFGLVGLVLAVTAVLILAPVNHAASR